MAFWVAELGPRSRRCPPAIETGTLALTAFWLLAAAPKAAWFVARVLGPGLCTAGTTQSASAEGDRPEGDERYGHAQ